MQTDYTSLGRNQIIARASGLERCVCYQPACPIRDQDVARGYDPRLASAFEISEAQKKVQEAKIVLSQAQLLERVDELCVVLDDIRKAAGLQVCSYTDLPEAIKRLVNPVTQKPKEVQRTSETKAQYLDVGHDDFTSKR
jgi:hypothetical protein